MGSGSGGGGAYGALSGGGGGEGDGEGGWDRDRRGGAGCERCWRQRLCCRRLEATWQPRASAIVFAVVLIVCRLFDVLSMFGDCAAVGLLYLPLIFRANPAHNLTCSPSCIIVFKVLDLVAWSVLYPVAVLLALKQNSNAWRSLGRAAIRDIARARSVAAGGGGASRAQRRAHERECGRAGAAAADARRIAFAPHRHVHCAGTAAATAARRSLCSAAAPPRL